MCWIGTTDLKAAMGDRHVGMGPVAQAVAASSYKEVVLLNNLEKDDATVYFKWLQKRTTSKITLHHFSLTSPTNFGEIYKADSTICFQKAKEHGHKNNFVFHLSPGTPAMAAVWIFLAKTIFPAELIESSKQYGVRKVSVPFDISADFIPDLYRRPDQTLERLAAGLPSDGAEFRDIFHRSEVMHQVLLKAQRIAPRSVPVLLEGESGTGKELIARAIHAASFRKEKPFITINCGAIPSELVESELFGHEKGAFTGAVSARTGHFETAHEGTIFLDEIGELPKNIQVKLLPVLQAGALKPIGATQSRTVDIRIIAATNRNLVEQVASGGFREDLFYRLAVAVIRIPPLRTRPGDVEWLVEKFLEQINNESKEQPGYNYKIISSSARNLLLKHSWPGNVRELQNTLLRAAAWSVNNELGEEDIRQALLPVPTSSTCKGDILHRPLEEGINLPEIMKTVAVHYLERGLAKFNGNKTMTAKILGLPSYQTLTNWLKKYGID
jgi:transcriptional regulator with PAS, ATPase and Fis domain